MGVCMSGPATKGEELHAFKDSPWRLLEQLSLWLKATNWSQLRYHQQYFLSVVGKIV